MTEHHSSPSLDDCVQRVESALDRLLPAAGTQPARLHEAMRYACLNGGKRIRAMLVYAAGSAAGAAPGDLDAAAGAVEMVHAYSLIHDDLPAMDDDDLRRGRPTCHIAFDEATAILAGDALQARAFEILASGESTLPWQRRARMVAVLAAAAGSQGMVGGQVLDMDGEHRALGLEELGAIHRAKTGALITAAVLLGGLAAPRADDAVLAAFERFGKEIGIAFQIIDDVLDETGDTERLGKRAGSDREAGKSTYPSAIGVARSKQLAQEHYDSALSALDALAGDTGMLRRIAHMVVARSS
ncbi:MAG TPA: farnesyl diphosphate synthase [Arenicellales bacterium]|nr:farnesyl diphosphate synthase [Arenicellales bacterium]